MSKHDPHPKEAEALRFCELYRNHTEEAFNEALSSVESSHLKDDRMLAEHLQEALLRAQTAWFDVEQPELNQQTPRAYVAGLSEREELLGFIRVTALNMDESLPPELVSLLREHQVKLEPQLIEWAQAGHAVAYDSQDELPQDLLLAIRSTDLLGQWRVSPEETELMQGYLALDEPAQIWSETIQAYLTAQGAQAIPAIVGELERMDAGGQAGPRKRREVEDYLLLALTAIGQEAPDERIYQTLRRIFRQTTPRLIPVICLGDYGDPRAVTMLRHYLIREAHMTDETTYYEIISTILRLGGQTDDLPDPFSGSKR